MDPNHWKRIKRSGCFKRKVKSNYRAHQTSGLIHIDNNRACSQVSNDPQASGSVNCTMRGSVAVPIPENIADLCLSDCSDFSEHIENDNENERKLEEKNDEFIDEYKKWALDFNISHVALKKLNEILNKRIPFIVPSDPRTLLKTAKDIPIVLIGNGNYWHNGLINTLKNILHKLPDTPKCVSLNVNIDGLPLYNSSTHQVWPILCNVHEIPNLSPFVVGVYEGTSKPSNLYAYFQPFVNELQELLRDNLRIMSKDGTEFVIKVKIRAFICDSPARAMIKGVCNFNAKHGCLKCTVVGEYNHKSHTVTFIKTDCPRRNDADFRSKKYGDHHKHDSPLLQLPIDMIEQIPVGDSLHLIDLGIMKRLLFGWRDGNLGKIITKWSAREIEAVSQFLLCCKMPKEIHRSVRSLKDLSHWKGSEFRTFLLYLSIIILRNVLSHDAYQHFLCFFSAVTICSCEEHFQLLPVAEAMLKQFVDNYGKFYGREYMTSNVHNLIHVVDEVRRYGSLSSFNAYPFENKLYSIKRTIRQGNKPLQQIANRLIERHLVELDSIQNEIANKYPLKKTYIYQNVPITVIELKSFMLSTANENKWFLSKNNHLVEMTSAICNEGCNYIIGNRIRNFRKDVFETPVKSSYFNIFMINANEISRCEATYNITDVKCKLVSVSHNANIYFIPLIHTFKTCL